jgi:CheY-like chemotaxis protein
MYHQIDNQINTALPEQLASTLKVLLAESDASAIERIICNTNAEFRSSIQSCNNYYDLLDKITEEDWDLLILGRIDKFNCFDICHQCHDLRRDLPIVLLSRQAIIDDSFRQLASARGATDIITNNPEQFNRLIQRLYHSFAQNPDRKPQLTTQITGALMVAGLTEIAQIAGNYFGNLAQGNYWRKAHTRIVGEFPYLTNWSADHFGKIGCNEILLTEELSREEIESLQIWTGLFIGECQRIIIDFREILNQSNLSTAAKKVLPKS